VRLLIALLLAMASYFGIIAVLVARQSTHDETQPADVIVIFGAAEYSGKPSPVLRARLDHALQLYNLHLARTIITTGGAGQDPHYSEGGVGREYLARHGVPEEQIIAETLSSNTERATERVATIMRVNGMKTCLAVSDAYHMFRIKHMMASHGVTAYASPRPESRHAGWLMIAREVLSFTLWKLRIT
jgi:uncharacterized SAM-binding protein YcdF (DUF218 family)